MRKISTAFLIVLTTVLFVLSTSINVVARANTDLGDLDTWVENNDATASFTPDISLTWDEYAGAYKGDVNTPFDGEVRFEVDYTWDDDHTSGDNPTGEHTFLLDVYIGGTSTQIGDHYEEVDSDKNTDGSGTLQVIATGVSVTDVFDCYLVATAYDTVDEAYDSVAVKIIIAMI